MIYLYIEILLNIYLNIRISTEQLYIVDEPSIRIPKIQPGLQLSDRIRQSHCLRGFFGERLLYLKFSFDYLTNDADFLLFRLQRFKRENGTIVLTRFMKKTIVSKYFKGEYIMPKTISIPAHYINNDDFSLSMDGYSFNIDGMVITNGPIVVSVFKDLVYGEQTTVLSVKKTIENFLELLEINGEGESEKFGFQFTITTLKPPKILFTNMFRVIVNRSTYSIDIEMVDSDDYHRD